MARACKYTIRHDSSMWSVLFISYFLIPSSAAVPLSIYVLSLPLPYMPGGTSLSTSFLVGAAVLVLGLLLYNLPQNSADQVKTE
uniref:Uncharacterized protein n=1 Tax=Aegilops tauschii subsp. strangulata TaxID=200361 RepID=A0A453IR32_AEGTS